MGVLGSRASLWICYMEDVTLAHAKEHLEELVARAVRGEDVRISDAAIGTVRLTVVGGTAGDGQARKPVRLGLMQGKMTVPEDLLAPMSEDELRDWYGK